MLKMKELEMISNTLEAMHTLTGMKRMKITKTRKKRNKNCGIDRAKGLLNLKEVSSDHSSTSIIFLKTHQLVMLIYNDRSQLEMKPSSIMRNSSLKKQLSKTRQEESKTPTGASIA
mmetsp:Transcript_27029/g.65682  ORF Transcript_27029/g.65682 Transcript_27029/m.65682 type:complete len:116 (+) Transcript_27029:1489-1836(+)